MKLREFITLLGGAVARLGLFEGLRPFSWRGAARDALAGATLASLNIPQVLGFTRIAGMPVVSGLYTVLLPLVAFAVFGSSRQLVVAAEPTTAAILAGSVSPLAMQGTPKYMALVGMVTLLTAGLLLLARLLKLGFLADFFSRAVLIGFFSGVGFQVGIAMLGGMLGLPVPSSNTADQVWKLLQDLPQLNIPTTCLSALVAGSILIGNRVVPRVPILLIAVVGTIAASAAFSFAEWGISIVGAVPSGLPTIVLPEVTWAETLALLPAAASCVVVIIAQSAATARVFASRHRERLDENADILGLAAANAAAAVSGTFVVNGSPTQTAIGDRSGAGSQIAQLVFAGIVLLVLVVGTGPLQYLPQSALAAIVFAIAVEMVDIRGLRDLRRESLGEYLLAIVTAAAIVMIGVAEGIVLGIALSLVWDARQRRAQTMVVADNTVTKQPARPVPKPRGSKVFISYRRDDTRDAAGRVYDWLVSKLPEKEIFFDVDTIPFGVDFKKSISDALSGSAVELVLVGEKWLNPNWRTSRWQFGSKPKEDFVQVEIESALELGVPIMPLLVDGVSMPDVESLPSSIAEFVSLNAAPIRAGRDFHLDMARVLEQIESFRKQSRQETPASS
jgi:MFS superfamily sulfate permease-like transporter